VDWQPQLVAAVVAVLVLRRLLEGQVAALAEVHQRYIPERRVLLVKEMPGELIITAICMELVVVVVLLPWVI